MYIVVTGDVGLGAVLVCRWECLEYYYCYGLEGHSASGAKGQMAAGKVIIIASVLSSLEAERYCNIAQRVVANVLTS